VPNALRKVEWQVKVLIKNLAIFSVPAAVSADIILNSAGGIFSQKLKE
jgi:hypothetical protein